VIALSSIPYAGSSERPHVLLADDHSAMLGLTTDVMAGELFVVGSLGDRCELLAEVERLHPDVVVLDITMPDLNGIEAAPQLKPARCRVKLVFLTLHEDPDYVRTAYFAKACPASDLMTTIHGAPKKTAPFRQYFLKDL
jgi:DNA-binding NarL/FixJ family response regulator